MGTELHWIDGPWLGRVSVSARPRGGDWLADDLAAWKRAGIDVILSMLTPEEELELGLDGESGAARAQGLTYLSFPIPDRDVPRSEAALAEVLEKVTDELKAGTNVLVHCRQGIGRSGLVAACLLVKNGMTPVAAVEKVSAARGYQIPDTDEQREWIDHYAAAVVK